MLIQTGSFLLLLVNAGLTLWGWTVLAQTGAESIPIGQLITGGGSLGINAVIVFWFVSHLNAVRDANEKRVAEIIKAGAESEAKLRDSHKDELARRDAQHADMAKELVSDVIAVQRESGGLMKAVLQTLAAFQQQYNLPKTPLQGENGG